MSDNLDIVPWIGFHRKNRNRQEVVQALTLPSARAKTANAFRCSVELVDAQVVCEGETIEEAKARVLAGSFGA